MKRKSDKILIVLLFIVGIALLSWIIPQGVYNIGIYQAAETSRAGIFDIFVQMCFAIYYSYSDIIFILVVGGCYGVLSKSKRYRKLVDKTASLIKGKEEIALVVTTLIISLFTSISDLLLPMFVFVPFIITVFLKNGKDRLTALAASFGGMLVGFVGSTFSMYAFDYVNEVTNLEINSLIGLKIAFYLIALVLFNVFAILHMKKTKRVDDTEYDLFLTEELDESKIKNKKKKTKLWPIITVFAVLFVLVVLGQIDWENSFKVTFFTNLYTKFQSAFKIADIPLFSALLGEQFSAFGKWDNLILMSFLFLVVTIIIAISEKMKFRDFVLRFDVGIKKVLRLAIIYGLVQTVYFMTVSYQWLPTVINKLFGSGAFSIPTIFIVSIIASVFLVNPGYGNYTYGYYLSYMMGEKLADSVLIWHLGQAFAMILAPTSILVVLALTYLDVPYKKWLKYIWKFALSFFVIVFLILIVKVVM